MHMSQDAVTSALSADGWNPMVESKGGTTMENWETLVGPTAAFTSADVAVVELGTNDCDSTCTDLGPAIDRIVTSLVRAGVGAVLWLNVQEVPAYPAHSRYVNYAIEQAAVRWPQMEVVDMRDLFDAHPEWHGPDGLHFNAIGEQELAILIRSGLAPFIGGRRA
jgi:lysophospholipase L1-like esterase